MRSSNIQCKTITTRNDINFRKSSAIISGQLKKSRCQTPSTMVTGPKGMYHNSCSNSQNYLQKSTKILEIKESKKLQDVQKPKKCLRNVKRRTQEISMKRQKGSDEQMKMMQNSTVSRMISTTRSVDSFNTYDKAVQCNGTFESYNQRFDVFNPILTLGFLMKELEDLEKNEKTSKIVADMKRVLSRISMENDSESEVVLRAKLQSKSIEFEEIYRKMIEKSEQEHSYSQNLLRQTNLFPREAEKPKLNLKVFIKTLKHKLEEARKKIREKEEIISVLKENNKKARVSEKLIKELNHELLQQSVAAKETRTELENLKLRTDKFLVLISYKDSQITDLRNLLRDYQDHVSEHLLKMEKETHPEECCFNFQNIPPPRNEAISSASNSLRSLTSIPEYCKSKCECHKNTKSRLSLSVKQGETSANEKQVENIFENVKFNSENSMNIPKVSKSYSSDSTIISTIASSSSTVRMKDREEAKK